MQSLPENQFAVTCIFRQHRMISNPYQPLFIIRTDRMQGEIVSIGFLCSFYRVIQNMVNLNGIGAVNPPTLAQYRER